MDFNEQSGYSQKGWVHFNEIFTTCANQRTKLCNNLPIVGKFVGTIRNKEGWLLASRAWLRKVNTFLCLHLSDSASIRAQISRSTFPKLLAILAKKFWQIEYHPPYYGILLTNNLWQAWISWAMFLINIIR